MQLHDQVGAAAAADAGHEKASAEQVAPQRTEYLSREADAMSSADAEALENLKALSHEWLSQVHPWEHLEQI